MSPVTTLSAKPSGFIKRVLPFVVCVAAWLWAFWADISSAHVNRILMSVVWLVAIVAIMVFNLRRLWRIADLVEDHGDTLRIRRWTRTVELPLREISRVTREPGTVSQIVTVCLAHPCQLGPEVTFYAPSVHKVPDIIEKLDSLARRVRDREPSRTA
jgi:hypothetical protein